VLHVDLDQFIAAVEIARRPELRGRPVVVGGSGDPNSRSVVATASYEAREFGVHSGMPMRMAANAVRTRCSCLRPAATTRCRAGDGHPAWVPVVVEVLGWDEAFVGAHTADRRRWPLSSAGGGRETGMSCSVGIGDNKLRAKIATGFAKPAGIYRLTKDNWSR